MLPITELKTLFCLSYLLKWNLMVNSFLEKGSLVFFLYKVSITAAV